VGITTADEYNQLDQIAHLRNGDVSITAGPHNMTIVPDNGWRHPNGVVQSGSGGGVSSQPLPSGKPIRPPSVYELEGPEAVVDVREKPENDDDHGVGSSPSCSGGKTVGETATGGNTSSSSTKNTRTDSKGRSVADPNFNGVQPILLDLDGDGIEITELSQSTMFFDTTGTGLKSRTAWAGAGDGVLFSMPMVMARSAKNVNLSLLTRTQMPRTI
jgi:hypothetical protein